MYFLKKNNKIMVGFLNAAIYNFNNKNVYLVNKKIVSYILENKFGMIPIELIDVMIRETILTTELAESESEPQVFQYELFDDKYSYEKCKLVYLEITDVCNFHCIHCYADVKKDATHFMTLQDTSHYVKEIASLGPCDVRITGGEPFLNSNVCEIVDTIVDSVSPISKHSIVSNGSFDIKQALYILSKGLELQISIYGMNESKFCEFTRSNAGMYKKVRANLEYISQTEYKEQILLLFSVNSLTYEEITEFRAMTEEFGFRYIFNRPASVGRAVENWDKLRLNQNYMEAFSKSQRPAKPFYCYHLCQLYWTSIMVNGDITPCGFLRTKDHVVGNLKTETFIDVWNSDKYNEFRKMCAHDVKHCQNCEFKFVCTAGCCGETASYSGDILNCYSGCQLKPYQNNQYWKINDNEMYQASKIAAGMFEFVKRGDSLDS